MKKAFLMLFLLGLGLPLVSCSSDSDTDSDDNSKEYRIYGTVVDATTGDPVNKASVAVYSQFINLVDVLGQSVTGSDGNFNFTYPAAYSVSGEYGYSLVVICDGYETYRINFKSPTSVQKYDVLLTPKY